LLRRVQYSSQETISGSVFLSGTPPLPSVELAKLLLVLLVRELAKWLPPPFDEEPPPDEEPLLRELAKREATANPASARITRTTTTSLFREPFLSIFTESVCVFLRQLRIKIQELCS